MALSCLLVLAACGGDDDDAGDSDAGDPGEFAVQLVEQRLKGQNQAAYDTLVAEQQAVVDSDLFVQCEGQKLYGDLEVEVDEINDREVVIPKLDKIPTKAVTLKLGDGEDAVFNTINVFEIDGEWHWSLTPQNLESYEAGECPDS